HRFPLAVRLADFDECVADTHRRMCDQAIRCFVWLLDHLRTKRLSHEIDQSISAPRMQERRDRTVSRPDRLSRGLMRGDVRLVSPSILHPCLTIAVELVDRLADRRRAGGK